MVKWGNDQTKHKRITNPEKSFNVKSFTSFYNIGMVPMINFLWKTIQDIYKKVISIG